MVGILGCNCCKCCSDPTSYWEANFAVTPAVGSVWDEVLEVSGPATRSYAPPPSAKSIKKTSRLKINADDLSPLYQGFNSSPKGVEFTAAWSGVLDAFSFAKSIGTWTAPTTDYAVHKMKLIILSELIYNVGSDVLKTGVHASWQKIFIGPRKIYTLEMYGYTKVNSNPAVIQQQYGPTNVEYPNFPFGPRPIFKIKHLTDRLGAFDSKCKAIAEVKLAQTDFFKADNALDPMLGVGQQPRYTSVDDQKFDCFVGWNSEVRWETSLGSGKSTGVFDFDGYYVSWLNARWQ